jgi:hypothetical protein
MIFNSISVQGLCKSSRSDEDLIKVLIVLGNMTSQRFSTHNKQGQSMFHKCRAASEEASYQHHNRDGNQNVHADEVRVNVENLHPLAEVRLDSDPDWEGEQSQSDQLERKMREKSQKGEVEWAPSNFIKKILRRNGSQWLIEFRFTPRIAGKFSLEKRFFSFVMLSTSSSSLRFIKFPLLALLFPPSAESLMYVISPTPSTSCHFLSENELRVLVILNSARDLGETSSSFRRPDGGELSIFAAAAQWTLRTMNFFFASEKKSPARGRASERNNFMFALRRKKKKAERRESFAFLGNNKASRAHRKKGGQWVPIFNSNTSRHPSPVRLLSPL